MVAALGALRPSSSGATQRPAAKSAALAQAEERV